MLLKVKQWNLWKYSFTVSLFFTLSNSFAQDLTYTRSVIDSLSSPSFNGRGYVNRGDEIAARFLEKEFKNIGLTPAHRKSYRQNFTFSVNTFPSEISVSIDGVKLEAGKDFIVDPGMQSMDGEFDLFYFDKTILHSKRQLKKLDKINFRNKIIVIDREGFDEKKNKSSKSINDLLDYIKAQVFKNAGSILIVDKLTWGVSTEKGFPQIQVLKGILNKTQRKIKIKVVNEFFDNYQSQNLIGYIKGKTNPDSFIVFSAHYDHLGRMGKETYFPGANDNASGVSMLLNLAKHYTLTPPEYSIYFIAFAAEEAGLIGSKYFTEHPLIELRKIKFLINLDLLGTGDDGITVVNATEFKDQFEKLKKINEEKSYLKEVKSRGKAANSDHHYFTEKGVPSFFIYTIGGIKAYHDIFDIPKTLPLTKYKEVFSLLIDFTDTLMKLK